MRNITVAVAAFVSIIAISCSIAVTARQQTPAGARAEDEAGIRKIVSRMQEGWNTGDGKAFAAPFAEDADYVVINGMRVKGRVAIDAGHQSIFDTVYKNSNNTPVIHSIRFLRNDVAVAHVEWSLKFHDGAVTREGKAMNTLVLTKDNGQWSIAAFQNTSIAAAQK